MSVDAFQTSSILDRLPVTSDPPVPDDLPPLPPIEAYDDEPRAPAPPSPKDQRSLVERRPIDWTSLQGKQPPQREWAVDDWLPMNATALCAGLGGIGKTLLMQTLATAIVTGREYVGVISRRRRVLFWAGEDDHDELWRRQLAICRLFDLDLPTLQDRLIVQSYASQDITLANALMGNLEPTAMLKELREQIGDYKAEYVILDSVARIFGGSENDRHQVTTFIALLGEACATTGAGLCLIGHPGKAAGSEYSGSTAWEGSVRSRLYLSTKLPNAADDDDDEGGDADSVRYISRRKANYSAKDWCKLIYQDGVLVPEDRPRPPVGVQGGEFGKDAVLRAVRKLAELNMYGTASTASPNFLPKLAEQYGLLEGFSRKQFGAFMRELMVEKRLANQVVGRYASNRNPREGLVEVSP